MHSDQKAAYAMTIDPRAIVPGYVDEYGTSGAAWLQNSGGRFKVVRCGRRWGKSVFGGIQAANLAAKGYPVGWFAPDYKTLSEVYEEILDYLQPIKRSATKAGGVIRTKTGGRVDFWSLENERAGRSRKYKKVFLDESAFTKASMIDIWDKSIKPTLLDMTGSALVMSNTNGIAANNFMHMICNDPKHGFICYHAPSWANPTIPGHLPGESEADFEVRRAAVYEEIRDRTHPLVFQQEYGAEFIDFSGVAFFDKQKLLQDGQGLPVPEHCDFVFAVIDSATKTGKEHDGTAVTYYARNKFYGQPLVVLDWDIVQIEGDLLPNWLDGVFQNLAHWSKRCGARSGSLGAFIEDKASGMVLIMAAQRRGLPAHAIPGVLTAVGKDERALSVSGYVYSGQVKMTQEAYDRTISYKGAPSQNQFIAQVCGFKIGVKDQMDDLLDTFTYGVAIALGDGEGI